MENRLSTVALARSGSPGPGQLLHIPVGLTTMRSGSSSTTGLDATQPIWALSRFGELRDDVIVVYIDPLIDHPRPNGLLWRGRCVVNKSSGSQAPWRGICAVTEIL